MLLLLLLDSKLSRGPEIVCWSLWLADRYWALLALVLSNIEWIWDNLRMLQDTSNFPLCWISSRCCVLVSTLLSFLEKLQDLDWCLLDFCNCLLSASALWYLAHVTAAFLSNTTKELLASRVHRILALLRSRSSSGSVSVQVFTEDGCSGIWSLCQRLLVCIRVLALVKDSGWLVGRILHVHEFYTVDNLVWMNGSVTSGAADCVRCGSELMSRHQKRRIVRLWLLCCCGCWKAGRLRQIRVPGKGCRLLRSIEQPYLLLHTLLWLTKHVKLSCRLGVVSNAC